MGERRVAVGAGGGDEIVRTRRERAVEQASLGFTEEETRDRRSGVGDVLDAADAVDRRVVADDETVDAVEFGEDSVGGHPLDRERVSGVGQSIRGLGGVRSRRPEIQRVDRPLLPGIHGHIQRFDQKEGSCELVG